MQIADQSRTGGYSESLTVKMPRIRAQLEKHLNFGVGKEEEPELRGMYEQMASIDFNALALVINTKNKPESDLERWQLLGMHSMKHFQEQRYQLAVEKDLELELEDSGEDVDDLETLDVMKSLKNQFANIKQRQLDQSKRSRSKDFMVSSNMRITDFIQSKEKARSQERGHDALPAMDLLEPEAPQEEPLLSQVKELPEDSQEYSFLTELQFPSSQKTKEQAPVSESIHYLHGDKITRHPGKKFERYPGFVEHKRAFYSSKEDLL